MSKIIEEYTLIKTNHKLLYIQYSRSFCMQEVQPLDFGSCFYISCNTTAHAVYTGVPRTENTVAVFLEIISRDRKFDLRDLSSRTNVVAVKSIRGQQTYYKRTSTNTT